MPTFVVGDVHGESALLERLLEELAPGADDEIVFLGDLIDRGPDSRGVVQRVVELSDDCAVTLLLGNHEAMLLAARDDPRCLSWLNYGGLDTIRSYAHGVAEACEPLMAGVFAHRESFPLEPFLAAVPDEHWALLERASLWERRAGFFIAHAGVDPSLAQPEETRRRALLEGHPAFPREHTGETRVLFGHHFSGKLRGDDAPLPFVSPRGNAIGLDVGSFHSGWLAALALEDEQLLLASNTGEVRRLTLSEV